MARYSSHRAVIASDEYQRGEANDYKNFFGKLEKIAKHAGEKWSHMDMLYYRETRQELVDEIIHDKIGLAFVLRQLNITKQVLEAVKPKVLIISNTMARRLLGKDRTQKDNLWPNYDFEFDNKIGTHRIKTEGPLKDVPVFFTSMITGMRALDLGSVERLEWHIKFVLNKI